MNISLSFFFCSDSVAQLWINFCWIMGRGPILLHTNHIKMMDNKLKNIAKQRYKDDIKKAHVILHQHYLTQPNVSTEKHGKYHSYNISKFIELPYHAFKTDFTSSTSTSSTFDRSIYLTDLNWIQTKLKATKCVQHILNDIFLLHNQEYLKCSHLRLLLQFFEYNTRPINYDADQFYPLLKHFMTTALAKQNPDWSEDSICNKWLNDFNDISISYLDIIDDNELATKDAECKDESGYDVITNLGGNGYFVASLNTLREEICVWNVPR